MYVDSGFTNADSAMNSEFTLYSNLHPYTVIYKPNEFQDRSTTDDTKDYSESENPTAAKDKPSTTADPTFYALCRITYFSNIL